MNDSLNMVLIFVAGLALGTVFFGGLWLTVRKAVVSKKPAMLIFGSFVFRMVFVLIGFYLTGAGNWQRLLAVLTGFIMARLLVICFTKATPRIAEKEAVHET